MPAPPVAPGDPPLPSSEAAEPPPPLTRSCPKCRARVALGLAYCPWCRTSLVPRSPDRPER